MVRSDPVHPRACGEHQFELGKEYYIDGSSPRLRGTLDNLIRRNIRRRFIPAPAGNTP